MLSPLTHVRRHVDGATMDHAACTTSGCACRRCGVTLWLQPAQLPGRRTRPGLLWQKRRLVGGVHRADHVPGAVLVPPHAVSQTPPVLMHCIAAVPTALALPPYLDPSFLLLLLHLPAASSGALRGRLTEASTPSPMRVH